VLLPLLLPLPLLKVSQVRLQLFALLVQELVMGLAHEGDVSG
jgi:hypothetical protein